MGGQVVQSSEFGFEKEKIQFDREREIEMSTLTGWKTFQIVPKQTVKQQIVPKPVMKEYSREELDALSEKELRDLLIQIMGSNLAPKKGRDPQQATDIYNALQIILHIPCTFRAVLHILNTFLVYS